MICERRWRMPEGASQGVRNARFTESTHPVRLQA